MPRKLDRQHVDHGRQQHRQHPPQLLAVDEDRRVSRVLPSSAWYEDAQRRRCRGSGRCRTGNSPSRGPSLVQPAPSARLSIDDHAADRKQSTATTAIDRRWSATPARLPPSDSCLIHRDAPAKLARPMALARSDGAARCWPAVARTRRRASAASLGQEAGFLHQLRGAWLSACSSHLREFLAGHGRSVLKAPFSMNSFHSGVSRTFFSRST